MVPCTTFSARARPRVETSRSYLPIFWLEDNTEINVAQLLLNVAFAALAGAIVANMSKRALYAMGIGIVVVAAGVVVIAFLNAWQQERQSAIQRAQSDEAYAAQLHWKNRVDAAKAQLLNAADNWRIAHRPNEERRVREKARTLVAPTWGETDPVIHFDPDPNFDDLIPTRTPTPRKPTKTFDPDEYLGIKKAATPSPANRRP